MTSTVKEKKVVEDDLVDGARVKGSRVRVSDIAVDRDYHGLSPEEIAEEYPVSVSEVYSALSFYRENPEEIRKEIREREDKIKG
ncbi:MAG: DUF433 domain-containing protein [Candidatus Nanohaloarchaea archaeon]